jgi:decaprenylphospho-beta-D-ribofuranose 2-oxidase
VSWIDCFGSGNSLGRGLFHAAWYADGGLPSLKPEHQDLPDTIMGLLPKSTVWRYLKMFSNRPLMHLLNWAKYSSSKVMGNGAMHSQSLVAFSFLLDYVPNWRWAYLPGGFVQYQSFIPKEHAVSVFEQQILLQQEVKLESYLGVMKRHRPDKFLLSHAVDGYSLALDFKVTDGNWHRIQELAHRMNDLVLSAGGRFYFAKDLTLRPSEARAYLGEETLGEFDRFRRQMDPDGLLTNQLAERVGLVTP